MFAAYCSFRQEGDGSRRAGEISSEPGREVFITKKVSNAYL